MSGGGRSTMVNKSLEFMSLATLNMDIGWRASG